LGYQAFSLLLYLVLDRDVSAVPFGDESEEAGGSVHRRSNLVGMHIRIKGDVPLVATFSGKMPNVSNDSDYVPALARDSYAVDVVAREFYGEYVLVWFSAKCHGNSLAGRRFPCVRRTGKCGSIGGDGRWMGLSEEFKPVDSVGWG